MKKKEEREKRVEEEKKKKNSLYTNGRLWNFLDSTMRICRVVSL